VKTPTAVVTRVFLLKVR